MTQRLPRVYRNFEEFEQSERSATTPEASKAPLPLLTIDQMLEMAFPSSTLVAVEDREVPDDLPDNLIELFEIRGPVRFG